MRARPGHGDTCGADMKPVYLEDTGSQKVLHLLQHSRAGSGLQDCVWVVGEHWCRKLGFQTASHTTALFRMQGEV